MNYTRLARRLDDLIARGHNPIGDLPESAREFVYGDISPLLTAYLARRRAEFRKTFDPSLITVEEVSWADFQIEVDPLRPYHVWGVYLHDTDLAERVKEAPPSVKKVLIGDGQPLPGMYHIRSLGVVRND